MISNGQNYSFTTPILNELNISPNSISEIGSRDGYDAEYLANAHKVPVLVFEPDAINAATCRKTLANVENVKVFEIALSDKNGSTEFFSVDPTLYSNCGASSLFPIDFSNRARSDPDRNREAVQKRVTVKTARFDTLGETTPDLIAMDVQGAELLVLKGFGKLLDEVCAIALEASIVPAYKGGATFKQVHRYLTARGFSLVFNTQTNSHTLPSAPLLKRLAKRYTSAFDCLYVRT